MQETFDFLDMGFFTKAEVFPGSLGTFRYRFQRTGWMETGSIQAWVYENVCFEKAQDAETAVFQWTEEGVAALRAWLRERLAERGARPYRILPDAAATKP